MKTFREKKGLSGRGKGKCSQAIKRIEMLLNSKWQSINQDTLYKKIIY